MKHYRSFTVTHVPVTNTKPSRVKIYDNRFKVSKLVSYHSSNLERQEEIAAEYLANMGIDCTFVSEGQKGFILLTESFKPMVL